MIPTLKGLMTGILKLVTNFLNYLSVYENKERIKKYICWLLIATIIIIPYISPKPYDIMSGLNPVKSNSVISFENRRIVRDDEMTVTDAHTTVLKYMYDHFRDYQVSRFSYKNEVIMMWVYNSNGYGTYADIKKIGDLLKIRFPNNSIIIILVRNNGSVYAITEYRI